MGISLRSQKILWGRAGGKCSFPECGQDLIVDATKADEESLVGDVCHIVAAEPGGPRGRSELTPDERDEYDNLILLCKVHHKMVDDQLNTYTARVLHRYKDQHEARVRNAQKLDASKQRDDELYASCVDEWASRVDLDGWTRWTSRLLTEDELWMTVDRDNNLFEAHRWLLSRIWPDRYPELNSAFRSFGRVLADLQEVFREHARVAGKDDDVLIVPRFYKIPVFDEILYGRLLHEYMYHLEMIADLTLELTRAANYVCDRTRECLLPSFRLEAGSLLVQTGFFMEPASCQARPEYRVAERILAPYSGLEAFKEARSTRDVHFQWPRTYKP